MSNPRIDVIGYRSLGEAPGFLERDRLVRDSAVAVSERPGQIPEAMFRRLREICDDGQLVELTSRIALCGFFNRVIESLAIKPQEEEVPVGPAAAA